jgi:hypothetical protein
MGFTHVAMHNNVHACVSIFLLPSHIFSLLLPYTPYFLCLYAPGIEDPGASSVWSVCVCLCVCVRIRSLICSNCSKPPFSTQTLYAWHKTFTMSSPLHVHIPPWLKFFCSQVKVVQTAQNQTVFITGLPYLAHTITTSPSLHVYVPTFQVQSKGYCRLWLKFFCSQWKVFQIAPNQTVFTAGLSCLAQTFTMSPPLDVHIPTF